MSQGQGGSLPTGWAGVPLDDLLVSLESGKRPRGGARGVLEGVPSLGGEHLTYAGGFDFTNVKYVPREFASSMRRGHIRTGDVLIVKDGATTGKTTFVGEGFPFAEAVANEHLFVCRPVEQVLPAYLAGYLQSPQGQERMLDHFKGSAQGGINRTFATGTIVPVSPFPEQQRIAARLGAIERSRTSIAASLENARAALARFRTAVLAAAASGRLSEDWRPLHPDGGVEELLALAEDRRRAAVKRFVEIQPNPHGAGDDLPEGWVRAPLGLLLDELKYGTSKRSAYDQPGTPVLRIPNVSTGALSVEDLKYADLDDRELAALRLREDDLLMIRSNGSVQLVGTTVAATPAAEGMAYAGYLIRLRVDPEVLRPEFLCLVLASPQLRRQIELPARSTSGVHNINSQEVRGLFVPVPSLDEQAEIVRRAATALATADRLGDRIEKTATTLDRVWRASLARAFAGELVAGEAALAAEEGRDYESAEELLAR